MIETLFHQKRDILSILLFTIIFYSCEGPAGTPGSNADETCKSCHNPNVVDKMKDQYDLSKHATGTASLDAMGNSACAPCHESSGFSYVCSNNIPSTITLNSATGKYVNNYMCPDSLTYGKFSCKTCHSSIHKTYDTTDFYPLTNVSPVSMTMLAGNQTIDLSQDNSKSNLCVKCHQPRPITKSPTLSDGNAIDYNDLVNNPNTIIYDSAIGNSKPNTIVPGYRTHIHYGSVGAIFAGKGGVEFSGSIPAYTNSKHTTVASCQNCHMAYMYGGTGGHTFNAKGNFKGCNVADCHNDKPLSSSAPDFVNTQAQIKTLLGTLASKLKSGGIEILQRDNNPSTNLWYGLTANNYNGYIDIYDPTSNLSGRFQNPAPVKSWTTDQINTNKALPKFTSLKNVQLGAIINFQMCLRDFSLGAHNFPYTQALLTNSIDALVSSGY